VGPQYICICKQGLLLSGEGKKKNVIWPNPHNQKPQKIHGWKSGCQWLTPIILATQEAEIKRTAVQSQPREIVHKTLFRKKKSQKRAGKVAQGIDPELKPQYHRKKKPQNCRGGATLSWDSSQLWELYSLLVFYLNKLSCF
jgi:hypothetical protein